MARLVLPVQDQARRGHPYRHPPAFPHGRSLGRRPRLGTWKCPLSHRGGLVSDRDARWSRAAGHARLVTLGSSRAAGHARLLRSGAPAERATGRARTKDPIPKIPRPCQRRGVSVGSDGSIPEIHTRHRRLRRLPARRLQGDHPYGLHQLPGGSPRHLGSDPSHTRNTKQPHRQKSKKCSNAPCG
jgi:hypothetical protein